MYDAGNAGILFEKCLRGVKVLEVYLLKSRTYACYFLYSVNDIRFAVAEVVGNHHLVTRVLQFHCRMATDKSGSACH